MRRALAGRVEYLWSAQADLLLPEEGVRPTFGWTARVMRAVERGWSCSIDIQSLGEEVTRGSG